MTESLYHLADQTTLSAITARNVRSWLARERWSLRKIAPIMGMSNVALSRRMRGEVDFTITEIYNLAEILGCEVEDLLPQRKKAPQPDGPAGARESRLGESNPRPIHYEDLSCIVRLDEVRDAKRAAG